MGPFMLQPLRWRKLSAHKDVHEKRTKRLASSEASLSLVFGSCKLIGMFLGWRFRLVEHLMTSMQQSLNCWGDVD